MQYIIVVVYLRLGAAPRALRFQSLRKGGNARVAAEGIYRRRCDNGISVYVDSAYFVNLGILEELRVPVTLVRQFEVQAGLTDDPWRGLQKKVRLLGYIIEREPAECKYKRAYSSRLCSPETNPRLVDPQLAFPRTPK